MNRGPQPEPNRLAAEKSPYLLQHAYNPVAWYPWSEEAFSRARQEDKPIFLSIGYSTCHWCHVMERESFENPEIAAVLNERYISIKVDREERPDVDRVYMTAVQALTGSGGWPLSAWLTPELEPFYAGTYFPPESRRQMPGFADLLIQLSEAWRQQRDRVMESAGGIVAALREAAAPGNGETLDAEQALELAYTLFERSYDPRLGGFTGAPKFPRPTVLTFLMHYGFTSGRESAQQMALATLQRIWEGGINDHLGGGYHRYSVDGNWRVPHFEKMLYDQAQLVWAFLDAYQISSESFYADAAREILDYVRSDLTDPGGGFYSARDADSPVSAEHPEDKEEGAYYLWEKSEIEALLEAGEAELVISMFGISEGGNTLSDPLGELGSRNVLYRALTEAEAAKALGLSEGVVSKKVEHALEKLQAARALRPQPQLDDKVITAWNGLMISAFARAHQVLGQPEYLESATRAARFIISHNVAGGELRRRYRDGEAAHPAQLDDYAFLCLSLLDLYEASFDIRWLDHAAELCEGMIQRFSDNNGGALFDSREDDDLLLRSKEAYDGAEPGANSVAALCLLRLGAMLDREDWRQGAEAIFEDFAARLQREPHALPQMLNALLFRLGPQKQVVIAGRVGDEDTGKLLDVVHRRFLPDKILLCADGEKGQETLGRAVPALAEMRPIRRRATAYVCEHFACKVPTTEPDELDRQLGGAGPA